MAVEKSKRASVPIDQIVLSGTNVREEVGDVSDLATSIKTYGLLQPPVVVEQADRYVLICGHRRLAACRSIGMKEIPVEVRTDELSERELLEVMVVENVQRKHLSPLEEGKAFERMTERGLTQMQIGARIGKSQVYVSDRLMLLRLPEKVQRAVHVGDVGLARALKPYRKVREPRSDKPDERDVNLKWQSHHISRMTRFLSGGHVPVKMLEELDILRAILESLLANRCLRCGTREGYISKCCDQHTRSLCLGCFDETHPLEAAV